MKLTKQQEERSKQLSERARLLDVAQSMNGSGRYADEKFRQLIREYNNRVLLGRGDQQPSSFSIMRDFVDPDDEALILKIAPEKFYDVESTVILDEITSQVRKNPSRLIDAIEEGVIYHINIPGGLTGLKIKGKDQAVLFGMCLIRRGSELSTFALFGRHCDKAEFEELEIEVNRIHPDKDFLYPATGKINSARDNLFDIEGAYPVILLSRVDLERKTSVVRYVLSENKDSFDVYTDDREMFTELSVGKLALGPEATAEYFEKSFNGLSEYSDAFSLTSTMPDIIADLDNKDNLKIVRSPTDINIKSSKTIVRKLKKILAPDEARMFIQVNSIKSDLDPKSSYEIEGSHFHVEQKGYWKKISPDKVGRGKNGEEIYGVTWATVNETWEERFGVSPPENSRNFTITPYSSINGEIYVMRSAMHPHDVYKIGYTDKDSLERSKQLHRTSGQPDQFNLIMKWSVRNARAVEQAVHKSLDRYRLNKNREFFSLPFPEIRKEIEAEIERRRAEGDV